MAGFFVLVLSSHPKFQVANITASDIINLSLVRSVRKFWDMEPLSFFEKGSNIPPLLASGGFRRARSSLPTEARRAEVGYPRPCISSATWRKPYAVITKR